MGNDSRHTFELNYLRVRTGLIVKPTMRGVLVTNRWQGYRGVVNIDLEQAPLLDAAGRRDLAAKARRNDNIKLSLMLGTVGGFVAAVAGLIAHNAPLAGVGIGVAVPSALATLFVPQAVGDAEAQEAARDYNDRLAEYLGLPSAVVAPPFPVEAPPRAVPSR